MNRPEQLAKEIRAYCAAHADPKIAVKWQRYFTEGYDAWGLLDKEHEFWHAKQAEWLARGWKLAELLKLGEILFESGKYEEGSLAIRMLATQKDAIGKAEFAKIGRWFEGIRNWAHTDVLCGEILQPVLLSKRVPVDILTPWRESKHKFQRRAVPVSLLKLEVPLEFVAPLMQDEEKVVQQGLGWFLREQWKRRPRPVEAFLLDWKDKAPRLIYQYACEKMTPAQKSRYRRSKT
ncbi:MAG: DNA alkylation repair protein [Bryobacter sp.]|nr:DNA alkylation repair protein [Bryobacter sp.]